MKLSRPARRAFLVVHVAASACWLGLTLGLLALGTTAATTGSAAAVEASVRAMKLFADWLLLPAAFLTLLSGLVLALGTACCTSIARGPPRAARARRGAGWSSGWGPGRRGH